MIASLGALLSALRQHRLLDAQQLEEVHALHDRFPDAKALVVELIQRGLLTPHQGNLLLQDRGQELVLGAYVLLDRLGEGGMGQVFKARHRTLGRICALKVIHKERLADQDAVRRFQREVRAAAALVHPHIVLAYDADEIAGTHLLVMEYIDGAIDLAKRVKQGGPLSAPLACEYIRQAALALQHAHERGLVHRDIKPANMLLTADGKTVKVLDMGLARLDGHTADTEKSSTMTREGTLMGTPDFMAPEQAVNSHAADIRADIYSLGCSFYYLLSGRLPFAGNTLLDKLMQHRLHEPMPIERFQTPASVAAIVRKMMAKNPAERYQTPAEAAAALTALLTQGGAVFAQSKGNARSSDEAAFEYMAKRGDAPALRRRSFPWLVGGALLLAAAGVLILLANAFTPRRLPDNPVTAAKDIGDAWLKQVAALSAARQVEAVAVKLKERNPGFGEPLAHDIEGGVVIEVEITSEKVKDIAALQALRKLQALNIAGTQVADLSPLKGLPLTRLNCGNTPVKDLSPVQGMNLTRLTCVGTGVSDLAPLTGMQLLEIACDFHFERDADILRSLKTLVKINGRPAADFWSEANGDEQIRKVMAKLSELNPKMNPKCFGKRIENGNVTLLAFIGAYVNDLTPVRALPGLKMLHLGVQSGHESSLNLAGLQGLPLTRLDLYNTRTKDLSPLKGMPLTLLNCQVCSMKDIAALKELPSLKELYIDFNPQRDSEVLRSLATLERINGQPVAEFWRDVEMKKR